MVHTLRGAGWEPELKRKLMLPKIIAPGSKIVNGGMKKRVPGVPYVSQYDLDAN